jgi:hypothetical protein
MAAMITLRRVLTQSKPEIPCNVRVSRNTSSTSWPEIERDTITRWNDFNLETLNQSYGHILDLEFPAEQLAAPHAEHNFQGMDIKRTHDVLQLIGWNYRMLRSTVPFAKQRLELHPGVHLKHYARTNKSLIRIGDSQQPVQIDHFVALDDSTLSNLVMGLSRPSISFQGRSLVNCPTAVTKEGLWPMRQLANLCHMAQTRYGYIMTDQDLVVCRFYIPEGGVNQADELKVEVMAVPWTVHGESQLTTDLALWWLCMLALSPTQHCALATEEDMVGIDEWEVRYLNDEHGWVRRHRYSDVEQPVDPPPHSASQTPSLGNQAAFGIDPNNNLTLTITITLGNNQAPVQGGELNNDLSLWDAFPPADGEGSNN